jgi:periplasmic divalent cation tolerance protein
MKLSNYLVENKYAACANIFPIKSAYWWKGQIASDQEYVSILKTITGNWEILKTKVEEIHPYEIPCIMKIEVEANEKYEEWIRSEVKREG